MTSSMKGYKLMIKDLIESSIRVENVEELELKINNESEKESKDSK